MGDGPTVTTSGRDQRPRTGKGRFLKTQESNERDANAARLRAKGFSLQEISDRLDYGSASNARRAIENLKDAVITPAGEDLVQQEIDQLGYLQDRALAVLEAEHVMVSHGRVVAIDDVPLPDYAPVLAAINALKGLGESRRKLYGIDAAIKLEATVHEVSEQDLELAEILREAQAANAVAEANLRGQAR